MEGNARKAAAYCRMACEEGHLPIAPHLLFPQFLNEGIEEERRLGIAIGWSCSPCVTKCGCSGKHQGVAAESDPPPEAGERKIMDSRKRRGNVKWEVN